MAEVSLEGADVLARAALAAYELSPRTRVRLLHLAENATFLVEDPVGGRKVLRVYRSGLHSRAAIESELSWTGSLREAEVIETPAVVPTLAGELVHTVGVEESSAGLERHAVMFEWCAGGEPDPSDPASFECLGALTARLHEHARTWERPATFTRSSWDEEAILGSAPRWGSWRSGIGIGPAEATVLDRVEELVRDELATFGAGEDRFGLIHADLRSANLLVTPTGPDGLGHTAVIDFDDAGFGWFMFDFGSAVSFIEDDPRMPEWQEAWLTGYGSIAPLDADDEAILPTMVMLRRLQLTAWMGTHAHASEVARLGVSYVQGTMRLAHDYLEGL